MKYQVVSITVGLIMSSGAKMLSKNYLFFGIQVLSLLCCLSRGSSTGSSKTKPTTIGIGVLLDSKSPFKATLESYMEMALQDFYSKNSHYKTRLYCHYKQVDSVLGVASAVQDLLANEEVHGIIGLLNPIEATIVAQLGERSHIPFISFSPSLSQSPYFIQASLDDYYRAKAIASICQYFNWTDIIIIYEEQNSVTNFVSKMNQEFNEVGVQKSLMMPIPSSAEDSYIAEQLNKTMNFTSTVIIVHVNSVSMANKLFLHAKKMGMMKVGYAWIITDSLSTLMASMSPSDIDAMDCGLGIRPYIPESVALENFKAKWKIDNNSILNDNGLWAYDIIWALSMALENIGDQINPSFSISTENTTVNNGIGDSNIRVSNIGPKLLEQLLSSKFEGLSGSFEIFQGKIQRQDVEIINILGSGGRIVGYWSHEKGIVSTMKYDEGNQGYSSSSMKQLKNIIWPGDTFTKPIGWFAKKTKLKIGVPQKAGFAEFVCVQGKNITGISIEIFNCALTYLSKKGIQLDHDFVPFPIDNQGSNSYNDMLKKIQDNVYDIVASDATIMANRTEYVEFALPYSESGVVMVVRNDRRGSMWIFVKPLRWDLWLSILVACIFIGLTLKFLEHPRDCDDIHSEAERQRESSLGLHLWFPITALAFPERNMVVNNWSRFVLVVWLCMAFILMQSYTAKLSSIFTVDQLRFDQNYNVGYQAGSFVKDVMIDTLGFPSSKLIPYSSIEEYHDAMTKGSKHGGVDAIFDELPYIKYMLRKYINKYKMIGQTYKTEGFGFAFHIGSPLVHHFSNAILEVLQNRGLCNTAINDVGPSGEGYPYANDDSSTISQDNPRLTAYDFGGLFIIVGSATLFALFCSECPYGKGMCRKLTHYSNKWFSFPRSQRTVTTRVHSDEILEQTEEHEPPPPPDNHQQDTAGVQMTTMGHVHSFERLEELKENEPLPSVHQTKDAAEVQLQAVRGEDNEHTDEKINK